MKKVILILLGLITILLSNPVKAQTFVCLITPLNPTGYPCSIPPGMITAANFQFLGSGLITTPFDLVIKGGTLIFPDDSIFQGDGHYNSLSNNLMIVDGTLRFANNDIFSGRGNYIKNIKLLQIQEGAFNFLLVKGATYDSTGKLDIFQGAVKVDEWMNINNAIDLKWQSNGFSGITGAFFFRIQTPDGIIMTNQDGMQFEYKRESIEFKSRTVVTNFILEYNDFQLNVKSMLPDGSILIDFINNKIVTEKTRTNFRFNLEETINLNAITESSILLNENKIECDNCKVDVESRMPRLARHTVNLVALGDSSIEIPDEHTHNVKGFGELTIGTDDFTMDGMIGHSIGDGEISNGEVRHHEEEATKQQIVEGYDVYGTIHGNGPALIDTQHSSTGVGHIEHDADQHKEGDGDGHGRRGDDTDIEFALGYSSAIVTDLLSQPEIEQHKPAIGEEEHDEALEKPIAGEAGMHTEEEAHEIATRSLSAVNRFLVGSMSRTLLSATRAPESFELNQEGIRLNRFGGGEINHNMANGQSARILLNLGSQETVSNLLAERKVGFYPSLSASYPVGKIIPSVELKPLEGSLSFTVGYPLAGGTLAVRKEVNGASTLLFQRESLEIMGNRNFFGIGAKIGEIAGIPIITYFGYGTPGEGLGHHH